MAYTAPTVEDFKEAYPAFDGVDDEVVENALAQAALQVDDTWLSQEDFTQGRMLYAAHVLTMGGSGTSQEAQLGSFKRLKLASLELERAGGDAVAGSWTATSYGVSFLQLQRQNRPGFLWVG
jgi:hypothetical protein